MNDKAEHALLDRMRKLVRPLAPQPAGCAARLDRLPAVRAVLFDVYGTLLVSGSGDIGTVLEDRSTAAALEAALGAAGFSGDLGAAGRRGVEVLAASIATAHQERRAAGCEHPEVEIRNTWRNVLGELRGAGLVREHVQPAILPILAIEYECRVNPVWPMPGMRRLLDSLRRRGYVLGIVSNAQFYTPLLLRLFFESPLEAAGLDPALSAWSYRSLEAKPSANLFRPVLTALWRRHGIAPDQAVYVGNDMLNDVRPAHHLGLKTALFAGDGRSYRPRLGDRTCEGLRPDCILTELPQLLDIL